MILKQLFENVTTQGYRSNVIKPLIALLIIMLTATIALFHYKIPFFGYCTGILSIIIVIIYLVAYLICLNKNPDLLRSERYNLEKTAMENVAIKGDSNSAQIQAPQREFIVIQNKNNSNE